MLKTHDQTYFDNTRQNIENYCRDLYVNNNKEAFIQIYNELGDMYNQYILINGNSRADFYDGIIVTPWDWITKDGKLNKFCYDLLNVDSYQNGDGYRIEDDGSISRDDQRLLSYIPVEIMYARAKEIIELNYRNISSNQLLMNLKSEQYRIEYASIFDQKIQPILPVAYLYNVLFKPSSFISDRIDRFSYLISQEDEEFVRKFYILFTIGIDGASYFYDDTNTYMMTPESIELLSKAPPMPENWKKAIIWAWSTRKKLSECWITECGLYAPQPQ